ncbi:MAG: 50S ribosomal protein L9 [Bdellovibrionales bacterium]|nr:50S ribosomal protein L9 [Bdellovibrionales bacterium]
MKIILTDDVVGVGDIGETVQVKPGYARNFLIPRGFAIEAETRNARQVAHRMRQIEAKKKRLKGDAEGRGKQLGALRPEMPLRVGSGGKVFGSVSARDLAAKLTEMGFEIDRRRVLLAEPIRKLGTHKVKIKLHSEVVVTIEVEVVAAEATKAEEDRAVEAGRQAIEARFAAREDEDDSFDDDEEEDSVD